MDKEKMSPRIKLLIRGIIGVAVIILLLALNPFVMIGAGERGVVLNWGAVSDKILGEGIHWRVPLQQKVEKLDVKIQKEEVAATSASKDLQDVQTTVALNYHLDAEKVNTLWQNVGKDYKERIIDPAIQEALKAATAEYTAEELITKRPEVKDKVKKTLFERLQREFIYVDELSIVNFSFSEAFNSAIEAKVTAEQNALAAKNKLEQVKYEADQRVAQATAEAEAIKIQAEAIQQQGGENYVNLKAVEKWNGTLPVYMMPDSSVPFINLNN